LIEIEDELKHPGTNDGVSERCDESFPKGDTPECFYQEAQFPDSPGFPLKTCGNDALGNRNDSSYEEIALSD
jgi:hypothetical protein